MSVSTESLKSLSDGSYLIGEYRAGYAGMREWVDKETGTKKTTIEAHILVEMIGARGGQGVRLYVNPPIGVTDPGKVPMPWKKGQRYVFPIRSLKAERGSIMGSLDEHREVIAL